MEKNRKESENPRNNTQRSGPKRQMGRNQRTKESISVDTIHIEKQRRAGVKINFKFVLSNCDGIRIGFQDFKLSVNFSISNSQILKYQGL